ncbi:secretion/conjugation apparatus DotM-related subunit [Asaia bogorensis]|uniref:DotM C-terminal cytoplasmic domain-containing protein n=2 Tax=Asaia TaxID=91914 RepID=A0A060QDC2_9PROT|nr:hypothetical protein [Asaia bogorensis]CDG38935.1 hypothetical protein ASAP_0890 [Asaia bogorensis]
MIGQGTDGGDRSAQIAFGILLLAVAIGAIVIMAWMRFHAQMATELIALRHAELQVALPFSSWARRLDIAVMQRAPQDMSATTLWTVLNLTGGVYRLLAAILLGLCTLLCFMRAANTRFPGSYDHAALQRELARTHPIGAAWAGRKLPPKNIEPQVQLLPLDPPLTPAEFLTRHAVIEGMFREMSAERALGAQCGRPWQGVVNACTLAQALALVFALHEDLRGGEAQDLLGALSLSIPHRKRDALEGPSSALRIPGSFSRMIRRRLGKEEALRQRIDMLGTAHGFETGILLTLLQKARLRGGLLNPGMFSAIQFYDRSLWLVLQAATFPREKGNWWEMSTTLCVESAAAIAHWQSECEAGTALATPIVARPLQMLRQIASHQTRNHEEGAQS